MLTAHQQIRIGRRLATARRAYKGGGYDGRIYLVWPEFDNLRLAGRPLR